MNTLPFQLECAAIVAQHVVDQFEASGRNQSRPVTIIHTISESELLDDTPVDTSKRSDVNVQLQIFISEYLAEWIDTCHKQVAQYGSAQRALTPGVWAVRSITLSRDSPETNITIAVTMRCLNPHPLPVS